MAITSKDVMELRNLTNVGMLDCKKALEEANGDIQKAQELLRQKGMASAAKRAGKIASQGIVDSYIHMGGTVGVLIEVNCETDFVARSEQFKTFVHDLALQIASMNPQYVDETQIPQDVRDQEMKIAMAQAKETGANKPEKILQQIADGKVKKVLKEMCLVDQPFFRDPSKTIKDLLNETTASIGEKLSIRRFVRYEMGEGLEKKQTEDLAAEVEAQINAMKK